MNNERLATIQRIRNIRKHPGADSLSIGDVLGWQVIFNHIKDPFKENDLVVYIVIDTILPDKPDFEFLRTKHFHIKPIRLRGQASNGICFPLNILGDFKNPEEGFDVTDIIGAIHYEKPVPAQLAGKIAGQRPNFISKTDELNLRSYPQLVEAMKGLPYYISRKDDGCLDKSTEILTENGIKTIENIHKEQYKGKCLSYNIIQNKIEYDNIVNSAISSNEFEWYEIEMDNGLKIKITGNHRVWIPKLKCYRKVEDLTENDEFMIEI